ncbi:glucokinase [Methylotuvimicrobium alcaliphilum]|uniref:Glucokinase n=1 Tax=Methylotuvimicrobium alcaliphilum (strain DSM 19304 / NCIMB 14124 / VKM B-2133 / 20Z) TaxID=1091494 RepID=G4T1H4_META2|nr:glucokinase [Methylotuvimicrobium alcaliphilum]CCE22396.1 Glucokinase [Methylotuvimicrobium alcaliphilum 20Z]
MILAGDIGGTKTTLALLSKNEHGLITLQQEQTFSSVEFPEFDEVLDKFLPAGVKVDSACFGVAGPVIEQRCEPTNLPWQLDAKALKKTLRTDRVRLLNDLEAMALGMLCLDEKDWVELNPNAKSQAGNMAVIAAGTGLGEAILYWDGARHHPIATEGGHCDFAAQTVQQDQLSNFLRKKYNGHVSFERLVSGMGFGNIYDFLVENRFAPACPAVPDCAYPSVYGCDRNAIISRLGINGEDPLCTETIRIFIELYGAEAGNLALKSFATGGVFIGGGIGPKIRSVLESGKFIEAFKAKGRFSGFLDTVSVKLSLNPRTPLMGAISYFG